MAVLVYVVVRLQVPLLLLKGWPNIDKSRPPGHLAGQDTGQIRLGRKQTMQGVY
ncbi:hypothetical protein DL89DRAFT_268054 [Linderina pennispora]|uniref:Uncharacterized protein n=1 Tax=Linderina pennispora TaxID=61395 RepID=A0A1Y1W663_9FUNG|nr:uncharacterized protein DL89DRAFT_268054 [Linderina pennispora]ORX69019.1 hypothetical protein DL89DRAFT_268054 [Linderina pennispora]